MKYKISFFVISLLMMCADVRIVAGWGGFFGGKSSGKGAFEGTVAKSAGYGNKATDPIEVRAHENVDPTQAKQKQPSYFFKKSSGDSAASRSNEKVTVDVNRLVRRHVQDVQQIVNLKAKLNSNFINSPDAVKQMKLQVIDSLASDAALQWSPEYVQRLKDYVNESPRFTWKQTVSDWLQDFIDWCLGRKLSDGMEKQSLVDRPEEGILIEKPTIKEVEKPVVAEAQVIDLSPEATVVESAQSKMNESDASVAQLEPVVEAPVVKNFSGPSFLSGLAVRKQLKKVEIQPKEIKEVVSISDQQALDRIQADVVDAIIDAIDPKKDPLFSLSAPDKARSLTQKKAQEYYKNKAVEQFELSRGSLVKLYKADNAQALAKLKQLSGDVAVDARVDRVMEELRIKKVNEDLVTYSGEIEQLGQGAFDKVSQKIKANQSEILANSRQSSVAQEAVIRNNARVAEQKRLTQAARADFEKNDSLIQDVVDKYKDDYFKEKQTLPSQEEIDAAVENYFNSNVVFNAIKDNKAATEKLADQKVLDWQAEQAKTPAQKAQESVAQKARAVAEKPIRDAVQLKYLADHNVRQAYLLTDAQKFELQSLKDQAVLANKVKIDKVVNQKVEAWKLEQFKTSKVDQAKKAKSNQKVKKAKVAAKNAQFLEQARKQGIIPKEQQSSKISNKASDIILLTSDAVVEPIPVVDSLVLPQSFSEAQIEGKIKGLQRLEGSSKQLMIAKLSQQASGFKSQINRILSDMNIPSDSPLFTNLAKELSVDAQKQIASWKNSKTQQFDPARFNDWLQGVVLKVNDALVANQ